VLVGLGVEGDLGAGARVELEDEALALAGDGGGLDDAAADDDGFARSGVDFGRRPGNVEAGGEGSGEEEGEVGAGEEKDAGGAEAREDCEEDECRERGEDFKGGKRDEPVNQDARGDGSQRPEQRVFRQLGGL
jgi:hypothetical protein